MTKVSNNAESKIYQGVCAIRRIPDPIIVDVLGAQLDFTDHEVVAMGGLIPTELKATLERFRICPLPQANMVLLSNVYCLGTTPIICT